MSIPNFQEFYNSVIEGKFPSELLEAKSGTVKVARFQQQSVYHQGKQYHYPVYYIIILPFEDNENEHIYVKMFKGNGKKPMYNTELCLDSQKIQINGHDLDSILTTYFEVCKDKAHLDLPIRNISSI